MGNFRIGEHPTHHTILTEQGHILHLAKGGLTPEYEQHIRSLPVVPHVLKLAQGGEVQHLDGGGTVYPPNIVTPEQRAAYDEARSNPAPLVSFFQRQPVNAPSVAPGMSPGAVPDYSGLTRGNAVPAATVQVASEPAPVGATQTAPAAPPYSGAGSPAWNPPAPAAGPSLTIPSGSFAPTPAAPSFDAARQIQSGARMEEQGAREKGEAEAKLHGDLATVYANANDRVAAVSDAYEHRRQENDTSLDSAVKAFQDQNLDPNRIWHNLGTAQKIGAGLSIALGGLAQGFFAAGGHDPGQNVALQVINTAIDRDIQSQVADMGKKKSMVSFYMERGHDLQSAQALARALEWENASHQAEVMAQKGGVDLSKAGADSAVGQIRARAAEARAQVAELTERTKGQVIQNEQARTNLEVGRALLNYRTQGGDTTNPTYRQHTEYMLSQDPKRREALVRDSAPTGRVDANGQPIWDQHLYEAPSSTEASKAQERLTQLNDQRATLDQMDRLLAQGPVGAWSPERRAGWNALARQYAEKEFAGALGSTRPPGDVKKRAEELADPGFIASLTGSGKASLAQLRKNVEGERAGILSPFTRHY